MALTISKLFTPRQLGATDSVIYTVPASPAGNVLKNCRVRLTNTTAGAVTVTLYADVAGDASGADNTFLSAHSIAANASFEVDVPTMAAGDTLRGLASAASSITIHEAGGVLHS